MAGLKFTKKQVARMAEVLDGEYSDVNEAAEAVLAAAVELVAERAKFTVVGQIASRLGHSIPPSDPQAEKVAIGLYATAGDANKAAEALWQSGVTNESARAWALPLFHGSPNDWYRTRKDAAAQLASDERSFREQELQRRIAWHRDNPDATPDQIPEDMRGFVPWHPPKNTCRTCGHVTTEESE